MDDVGVFFFDYVYCCEECMEVECVEDVPDCAEWCGFFVVVCVVEDV